MKHTNQAQLTLSIESCDAIKSLTSSGKVLLGERRLRRILRHKPKEDVTKPLPIQELLKWEKDQFILNCYRCILNRLPDPSGFEFHAATLKEKKRTKVQIIKLMRLSREGKHIGRQIIGFWSAVWFDFLQRRVLKVDPLSISDQA